MNSGSLNPKHSQALLPLHNPYCFLQHIEESWSTTFMTLSLLDSQSFRSRTSICGILSTQFGPWNSLNKWKKKRNWFMNYSTFIFLAFFVLLIVLWVWPPKDKLKNAVNMSLTSYLVWEKMKIHLVEWTYVFLEVSLFYHKWIFKYIDTFLLPCSAYHYLPESSLSICLNLRCLGLPPRATF